MKLKLIAAGILAACAAGATLRADEGSTAMYVQAHGNAILLTNADANNYFNVNDQIGTQGYAGGAIDVGWQIRREAAIEVGFGLGPFRNYDEAYYNQGSNTFATGQVKTDWNLYTWAVTPALTWTGPGYVHLLGLHLGLSTLAGQVTNGENGLDGSVNQVGYTPDIGVVLRTTYILAHHVSFGLELGWDYIVFNSITNSDGSGTYAGLNGTAHNADGGQTSLNFSGPHLGVVIGLWSRDPGGRGGERDRDLQE